MPAPPQTSAPGEVRRSLDEIETGSDSSEGIASSVKNFLPLLRVAGLAGSGDSSSDSGLVAVDLNFLFPGLGDNGQLQAVLNTDPQIYEPLATALSAFDPGTDPMDLIGQNLSDADDYALNFTYGLSSKTKGRNLEQHRTQFENLFLAATRSVQETTGASLFGEVVGALQGAQLNGLTEDQQANLQDVPFTEISDAAQRARLMDLFGRLAREAAAKERKIRENATMFGMRDFAKLLSNQPQLHAAVRRNVRDSVVGADSTTAEFTYELGFVNLNSFDQEAGAVCSGADDQNPDFAVVRACGVAIRDYVNRDDIRARLEHGDRLALSLAYTKVEDLSFTLPGSTFQFDAGGSSIVTFSVAYGRLFGLTSGMADTRIDLEAKYEDASDDDTRNDRVIASLTVTKKVGNLSIPFSLVYSNRSEFVGESDAKLGAHIGVVFNTFGDAK